MLRVPILTAGPGRDARGTGVPRPWRSNWTSRSSSAACILAQRSRTHTASGVANTFHTVIDHTYVDAVSKVVLQPGQSFLDAEYTNEGVLPDRITSLSVHTLGCLPFHFTGTPSHTLSVMITQMVRCRHWAAGTTSPQDWPDPKY